jgi:uncharacterized damage-inducible protein DinB
LSSNNAGTAIDRAVEAMQLFRNVKRDFRSTNSGRDRSVNPQEIPEPWLRGTRTEVPVVIRAVLDALELASEDVARWCGRLSDRQLNARPAGIAPVAFHIRHIARSIDRLLTYAENRDLTSEQVVALKTELDPGATRGELFAEFTEAIDRSSNRIRAFIPTLLEEPRSVGKRRLTTTVAGLLIHVADHTQRHVGQAVTTTQIVMSQMV